MRRALTALATSAVTVAALAAAPLTATAAPPPIVGGTPAWHNPGVVSLWSSTFITAPRHRCGGTLVRPRWVLSAAHCAVVTPEGETSVRVGSLDNTTGYVEREVVDVVVHPDYDDLTLEHDVMLLELDAPVPASVETPATYGAGSPAVGTVGRMFGWGWPCQGPGPGCNAATVELRELGVRVLPDASCVTQASPATQLCLGAADGSHANGCPGDSGTPVLTKGLGDTWVVRGVVIHDGDDPTGASCGSAPDGGPGLGVAVDVAAYLDWIVEVTSS